MLLFELLFHLSSLVAGFAHITVIL